MAKVPYSKLKCKINEDCVPVQIGEETIAVKQYLPIQEKLGLIGRVIALAHDEDKNYPNPVKENVFMELELVFAYSNLAFTDKHKEDIPKLYDQLNSSGVIKAILGAIPVEEQDLIINGIAKTSKGIYEYQYSVLGILDTLKTDYSNLNLDIEELQEKIQNPEALEFIKSILSKTN